MKVQKINKELLNLYYKNGRRLYCQIVADKTYVTDAYRVFILDSKEFMLNPLNLKTTSLTTFFDDRGYVDGFKTNKLKEQDKFLGVYIENKEENISVLIQQKYLDVFENYTLKIIAPDKPVLVYEKNEPVGLILPIREF